MTTTPQGRRVTPSAIQVLPASAPRERWLEERRKGVGSADASTICGVNPGRSLYTAYQDKVGALPSPEENDAMWLGTQMEPVIARLFTRLTGLRVRRSGLLRNVRTPWLQCTPDRVVSENGETGGLEIKFHNAMRREEWDGGEVSDHCLVQVIHDLAVTGWTWMYVLAVIDGNVPCLRRIERVPDGGVPRTAGALGVTETDIALLVQVEKRFWFEHVVPRVPPPVDGSDSTTGTLKTLYRTSDPGKRVVLGVERGTEMRELRDAADRAAREAAERLAQIKNRWVALIGDAEEAYLAGDEKRPLATRRPDRRGIRSLRFPDRKINENEWGVA
jgi:putative phage-type endonuclease